MELIAHRGNLNGPDEGLENSPAYIDQAIDKGFSVEVDLWIRKDSLYLGHDKPQYQITKEFLSIRSDKLYVHLKDNELNCLPDFMNNLNWFEHEDEAFVYTSKGDKWCYPSKSLLQDGINLMPELSWGKAEFDLFYKSPVPVCSDYVCKISCGEYCA